MANNPTIRRFQRDLREHPAKAALLGILLIVAVWYWTPTIGKWIGLSKPADAGPAKTASGKTEPKTEAAQTADSAKPKATSPKWQQIKQWIASDPNMQPASVAADVRDPFSKPDTKNSTQEVVQNKLLTPTEAGIVLQSTIVGGDKKTALVDGRAYRVGQTIRAPKGDGQFRLIEIDTQYIVLESEGKKYRLLLPSAQAAGLEEF